MFPAQDDRIKFDEYGEVILPEDYRIADLAGDMMDDNKENSLIKTEDIKKENDDGKIRSQNVNFTGIKLWNLANQNQKG